jgi:hypothetical protein
MTEVLNYEEQAIKFAEDHGITLETGDPIFGHHFENDPNMRYIFPCVLRKGNKSYKFKFGQSIADRDKKPTMYDILTCLEKNVPGTYHDFCDEYGYERSEVSSVKVYDAVTKEARAVNRMFTREEIDLMYDLENGDYQG